MAPEEDLKKRVARKLTKKRKEGHQVTMEIPERFRDGDDAEEDCTALNGKSVYMNQSVFGMIAAAGSQVDFNARFDGQSSDEEDEPSREGSDLQVDKTRKGKSAATAKPVKEEKHHRRKFSENKLLRSIPGLGSKSKLKSAKQSTSTTPDSPPEPQTPEIQLARVPTRDSMVMSRMLDAKAELAMRPSFDMVRGELGDNSSSDLSKKLMEIFEFDKAEDVIEGRTWKFMFLSKY